MDCLTQQQRHKNMSAIRSANTGPEMVVRKYLFAHKFRYRLNVRSLPGKPDIVLRKYRTCIFVNGCFWHRHEGCRNATLPKTNREFREKKFARNKKRDKEVLRQLAATGWHTIVIWECQLKPAKRENTLRSLELTLNHLFLSDRSLSSTEPAV